jgi:hypothetical protein
MGILKDGHYKLLPEHTIQWTRGGLHMLSADALKKLTDDGWMRQTKIMYKLSRMR